MPRIDNASIEELLQRARLEEVAAQFLGDLGERGANRFATCPKCGATKKERKFSISVPKQMCQCFRCKEAGAAGALNFLIKLQGKPYVQAVQWLADFYKFELRHEALASIGTAADGTTFDRSYFDQRMAEIGYREREGWEGLFTAHSSGGVVIRYPALAYTNEGGNWQQLGDGPFARMRLHPSRVTSTQKYTQEKDSGIRIFIPPAVVALYRSGQQFDALFLAEGEFKAYVMSEAGVPCVGIGGIDMFHRGREHKELHPDLMELARAGRCKALCLVHDADAHLVRWDPDTEPEKDLAERPRTFAGAVTRFRLAVGKLVPAVHYSWIKPEFAERGKGLDDLAALKGTDEVSAKLMELRSNALFTCRDISNVQWREIDGYFDLNIHQGVPKAFYNRHRELITDRPFVFKGGTYQYILDDNDAEGGRLELLRHPDSKLFIRVGCDHFKQLWRPNEFGKAVPYRKLWKDAYLQRDYVKKGVKNFLDTLERYDDFCNEPGHFGDYRPVVEVRGTVLFNKYFPLDHKPAPGSIDHITAYLVHAFGQRVVQTKDSNGRVISESENWEVYMDRLKLMMRLPRLKLPAVVLASEERNTGKSTLLAFNRALWQSNSVIIPNEAITDQFNSDWANALDIGINEALIEKQRDQERLKTLIVDLSGSKRGMYAEREQTANFTKLTITTNEQDTFVKIAPDEFRYWINVVPTIKQEDPDLLDKMIGEIPALCHVLLNEPLKHHTKMSRLWFANSVIDTEQRRAVAMASRGVVEMELRTWIEEQFYRFRWPELCYQVSDLKHHVNMDSGTKFRMSQFTHVMQNIWKMDARNEHMLIPFDPDRRQAEQKIGESVKRRWYVFSAADFVPAAAAREMLAEARAEWGGSPSRFGEHGHAEESMPLVFPEKFRKLEPVAVPA